MAEKYIIVASDNLDRDHIPDEIVCRDIPTWGMAQMIADTLNKELCVSDCSQYHYSAEKSDYKITTIEDIYG